MIALQYVIHMHEAHVFVQPWAAIIIGFTAGLVYVFAAWFIPNVLKIDDPLEAGAVHAFTGAWGLIMAAAFAHKPSVAAVYGEEVAAAGHGMPCPTTSLLQHNNFISGALRLPVVRRVDSLEATGNASCLPLACCRGPASHAITASSP